MSQNHHTTERVGYKHLTEIERYKIEAYVKDKRKPREIAKLLGKSVRTIQREIRRGTVTQLGPHLAEKKEYLADYAIRQHQETCRNRGPTPKLLQDLALREYIEKQIAKGYAPDIVIGRMKLEGKRFRQSVSTKTVYRSIEVGHFEQITNKDLLYKSKPKKKRRKNVRVAHNNLRGSSIEERPKSVEERQEYGHWEMDCVLSGKGKKAALLTLTERKSREEIIIKLWRKTSVKVKEALDILETSYGRKTFKKKFESITVDNGSEFLDFESLESSIRKGQRRTKIYYAHPYSAFERGSNENHNRMIRRKIPKGSNIGRYSKAHIRGVEGWMNDYPRKILGYKTPREVAEEEMAKAT